MNPKIDYKKYNKFMVDSVVFFLADSSDYKGIDPQEMKELADEFNKQIVAAFKDKWPIVAEPGPDVARYPHCHHQYQAEQARASAWSRRSFPSGWASAS